MPAPTTLQDVANAAGVHRSTVALALRDSRRISAAQRQRIQALAREMGYRVNPLVAALMKSRRARTASAGVAIAYVTSHPTRWGWRPPQVNRPDYFPGAEGRAAELGYRLEHFWLAEPGMTPGRFCAILESRGIHGVLLGRLPAGVDSVDLLWERFSCVALGRTLQTPRLHRVTEDHFASCVLAVERLRALGYRRIGLVFSDPDDSPGVGDRWLGAFLRKQHRLDAGDQIPCLWSALERPAPEAFQAWFTRWKPEVVLVTVAEPLLRWLEGMRVRVPEDVAVATLVNDHPERGWSGVYADPALMGALAAEMVVGLMHRGETGVPATPHEVLLPGAWIDGRTCPAR